MRNSITVVSTIIQIFASILSLLATPIALYYSFRAIEISNETLELERKFKQLSVKPLLEINVYSDTPRVELRNSGLGPARFRRFVIKIDQKCWSLRSNDPQADEISEEISKYFSAQIVDNAAKLYDRKIMSNITIISEPSFSGFIQANAKYNIISFILPQDKTHSEIADIGSVFMNVARRSAFLVEYESLFGEATYVGTPPSHFQCY